VGCGLQKKNKLFFSLSIVTLIVIINRIHLIGIDLADCLNVFFKIIIEELLV